MAGTTQSGARRRGGIVGINVTPMVDVVLVLLVIMMVSARYIVSKSLQVDLPSASTADASPSSPLAVTIQVDGALLLNGESVTDEAFLSRLAARAQLDPETNLIVSADQGALHGRVVEVMDGARSVGITHFAVQVEQAAP